MLVECICCGKEFNKPPSEIKKTGGKNYCSRSCSAKINNKKYPKRKQEGQCKKKYCANCNIEINNINKKYCSAACNIECVNKTNYTLIEKDGFTSKSSNLSIRKYLMKKHGNACMICGLNASNWNGKNITLIVDHIDGKANNYSMDNLRIVCPNCDSQLDTFKARNKGNSTRKYYIVQKNEQN